MTKICLIGFLLAALLACAQTTPTDTPASTYTHVPTAAVIPTATSEPTSTTALTPTPAPTWTPVPTRTPVPTATAAPSPTPVVRSANAGIETEIFTWEFSLGHHINVIGPADWENDVLEGAMFLRHSNDPPDAASRAWFLFENGAFDSFIRGRKALNYEYEYIDGNVDGIPAVFERGLITESGRPGLLSAFFAYEDLGYFWAVCPTQGGTPEAVAICESLLASISVDGQ